MNGMCQQGRKLAGDEVTAVGHGRELWRVRSLGDEPGRKSVAYPGNRTSIVSQVSAEKLVVAP